MTHSRVIDIEWLPMNDLIHKISVLLVFLGSSHNYISHVNFFEKVLLEWGKVVLEAWMTLIDWISFSFDLHLNAIKSIFLRLVFQISTKSLLLVMECVKFIGIKRR